MRVLFRGEGLGKAGGVRGWLGYIATRAGERCDAGGGTAKSATVGRGPWERSFGTERLLAPVLCLRVLARRGQ